MKVVLLCGGVGQRMFPITEDKFLLKFMGKTLLQYQIETAKKAGLTDFVIIGNPQNINRIAGIVSETSGAQAELAIQKEPSGIADALQHASQFLDDQVIVVNPNDVFESSVYTKLLEAQTGGTAASYLIGYRVNDYFPGGYLVVNDAGDLRRIVEKPGRGREPSSLINLVVHLHTDLGKLLQYAESVRTEKDDVYECAIDAMARDNYQIKVVPYSGFWAPLKYPWHLFPLLHQFLGSKLKYISPSARISAKATIEGVVIIDDNVRVLENAVIRGPVYIGPNSVIGNNSLVRDYSHIGADCVVGYSTEVKGSYVGDRCWFHMAYVGDSIIGDDCSFGAGTVLANFRFDERTVSVRVGDEPVDTGRDKLGAIIGNHSKTGVNVSIMPGIRVGPNATVGSHVCLTSDLAPDSFILTEPVNRIIRNRFRRPRKD